MKITGFLVLCMLAIVSLANAGLHSKNTHVSRRSCPIPRHPPLSKRMPMAAAIPGNSDGEFILVSGVYNSLNLYNYIVTARVLLSWFPQAQGVGFLRPVFVLADPLLNLFRGRIPPIGGFDISVLPAFFLLNFVTNAAPGALSAEIPQFCPQHAAKNFLNNVSNNLDTFMKNNFSN
mmetsp:Transcript_8454/g.11171  ORF Transcript_8454/g.11171 Transcript_8454/m.11171 type:complete len:176 (+) Transcript_8454:50-577(+)|eukprot:CAMPEP_0117768536 /NCGR_PEP_ID=MMETSP0947-20121206/22444_1 /TAXON_ID=44440 /ORGANISM="Chattonella subsalsa, Strain CCMP2191" /LENGTH=175 /DNA_ID=CAMNT_0005592757 /DNA_START=50 /DNA_END=577 /DNA_ORIENTATION=-